MALASELNIYEDTYQMVSRILDVDKNMCRTFKPTIGKMMTQNALELFASIEMVNRTSDTRKRQYHMEAFLVKLNLITTLLRLCHDKKLVSRGLYAELSYIITTIGKQMTAWKKSLK